MALVSRLEGVMSEGEIMDPKKMTPLCTMVWDWYKTLAPRLKEVMYTEDIHAVNKIIDEIEAHAVEIEYQCRI